MRSASVAEGQLDLTVVAFLLTDKQIGRRCHGLLQLHQAGALLARGIGHAGVRVGQRLGRAHHERHGQRTDREALLLAELVSLMYCAMIAAPPAADGAAMDVPLITP